MAGDWIKMSTGLGTHPKIVRISSALKADRFRVVGGLHAVWCLFDAHSADGSLEGYTLDALDDLIGWAGFSAALVAVDWLCVGPEGLNLPRFDNHNGQSAKRRAQETERKRNERKTSASDADKSETESGPEKRREEKSNSVPNGTGGKPPMSADEIIFTYGVPLLINAGSADKAARSFLGGLRKGHGDQAVVDALRSCLKEKPLQPIEWLAAKLPPHGAKSKPNAQEALEAANQAVAERFLAKENHVAQ